MGFRTTVVLYNDQCGAWGSDAQLGQKIAHGMNYAMNPESVNKWDSPSNLDYGRVIECAHADTQRLLAMDGYMGHWMPGSAFYRAGENKDDMKVRLLREAADAMGYKLVKKK